MTGVAAAQHWYSRPAARRWRCAPPDTDALAFHQSLPGYQPTALVERPGLADELGVRRVFVKDESGRLGLAAFKMLGVSWAAARVLAEPGRQGRPGRIGGFAELRSAAAQASADSQAELVTATDGNHGRALARLGSLLGLPVTVFVPALTPQATADAIAAEGACVRVADGDYDDAVASAAGYCAAIAGRTLIQDTAWPGYERIPGWIVAGYDTLLSEVDSQLRARGVPRIDLVSVPVGVGSLAQAVVTHYRDGAGPDSAGPDGAGPDGAGPGPAVLAVEPQAAPCLLASLPSQHFGTVPTAATVMAGLNCGTPSALAWPVLAAGLDAAIAVPDQAATLAMADLAAVGIPAGPSGAAALAGVRAALTGAAAAGRREELGVTADSVLVLLCTEGRWPGL